MHTEEIAQQGVASNGASDHSTASLIKYNAARSALAAAVAVDEVKDIRDKAEAMRIYAMQAKNKDLEVDAAEIRLRAERRLGELISAQKSSVGLNQGARIAGTAPGANDGSSAVVAHDHRPTLADAGISKDLSSRAQKLAAVPEDEFEEAMDEWRDRVEAEGARVTTQLEKAGERALAAKPEPQKSAKPSEVDALKARIAELEEQLLEAREAAADAGAIAQDLTAIAEGEGGQRMIQLEAELKAVRAVRDQLMRENSQLKRQVKGYMRRLGIQ